MNAALVLGMLLGALLRHVVPIIWKEATEMDRVEAMTRSRPLRRRKP